MHWRWDLSALAARAMKPSTPKTGLIPRRLVKTKTLVLSQLREENPIRSCICLYLGCIVACVCNVKKKK